MILTLLGVFMYLVFGFILGNIYAVLKYYQSFRYSSTTSEDVKIKLMVAVFMVFWPLCCAILIYKIYKRH